MHHLDLQRRLQQRRPLHLKTLDCDLLRPIPELAVAGSGYIHLSEEARHSLGH